MRLPSKVKILYDSLLGEWLKIYYSVFGKLFHYGINTSKNRKDKVIVSLTSYGRRVTSVLPYTIMSLLRQKYKPDMIILWLDEDNWNDENIPKSLKRLQKYGLTIKFCKDIKSYKKLIPTLLEYPMDIIITCDDDLYYKPTVIKDLVNAYYKNPSNIFVLNAHIIRFDNSGRILPYNKWTMDVRDKMGRYVFPTGGSGCLYRKNLLYQDVSNDELFMKLAPQADDVWFFFMAFLKGTIASVLPDRGRRYLPLDNFYQYFHKNANLSSANVKENQNDVQIKSVMAHYGIDLFLGNE